MLSVIIPSFAAKSSGLEVGIVVTRTTGSFFCPGWEGQISSCSGCRSLVLGLALLLGPDLGAGCVCLDRSLLFGGIESEVGSDWSPLRFAAGKYVVDGRQDGPL